MKTSSTLGLLFVLLFSFCLETSLIAQSAEQTVTDAANSINQKIDEMQMLLDEHVINSQTIRNSPEVAPIQEIADKWVRTMNFT